MQFRFTAEQELLRESVHSWVRSLRDNGVHRAALAGSDFGRDELWSQIVDLGWVGIAIPVELGGGGGDLVDACIVLEALAGGLAPLPFAGNAILVPAILRDNNPTLLTEVALGRRRIAPLISADFSWSERDTEMVAWDWWPGDDLLLWHPGAGDCGACWDH
jgi:alkylation response protein AidB-like acyl-CoA dehydrogenase